MKKLVLLFFLFQTTYSYCQDTTVKSLQTAVMNNISKFKTDTAKKTWKKAGLFSLNFTQGSLSNWAAGGDDFTLALNAYVNGSLNYKKGKYTWDNNVDIYLGYIKATSLGTRKNDDRIDVLSKYGIILNPKLSAAALFNFRTQSFDGFKYTSDTSTTFSSTFLSPGYVVVSPGIDYRPIKGVSVFLSPITSRFVIVYNNTIAGKGIYAPAGDNVKSEVGAFATINFATNPEKIISYKGRLDLFSNYKHDPQNIDVFIQNLFAAKLFKIFSVTWSLDVIYDDDVRLFGENGDVPRTQFKSLIGIGVLIRI